MILSVAQTTLLVRDYEEALQFYSERLGFKILEDTNLPSGKRWIRLGAPGGSGAELLLSKATTPEQQSLVGHQAGGRVLFFLKTNDLAKEYQELSKRDVIFLESPRTESYGKVAVFQDLYGNRIDLIEPG